MPFSCIQCGECCTNLGYVHTISEELGDFRYLLHNGYTGEDTCVSVDADKRELFLDTTPLKNNPHACPFFRHVPGSGNACCTIHRTRPGICRDYECWRLLIVDSRGRNAGKIRYVRSLCTEDALLRKIWDGCVEPISEPDDRAWEDMMIRTLVRAGYTVRK